MKKKRHKMVVFLRPSCHREEQTAKVFLGGIN